MSLFNLLVGLPVARLGKVVQPFLPARIIFLIKNCALLFDIATFLL